MVLKEVQVEAVAWDHVYNHIKPTAVVAATELEIPDILEKHNRPMSLSEISAAAGCLPHLLYRLMRFLIFHGIFKKVDPPPNAATSSVYYAQTPLSRLFAKDKLGAFMILQGSPVSRTPAGLTGEAIKTGIPDCLKSIAGEDIWADESSLCRTKVFTDAMTAHSRSTMAAIIKSYPTAFDGIQSVVHVGGRHGMALGDLVEAFPHVRGISLDLPEVVADAPPRKGVEFVGGSMFESIPKADTVLLMWVLHDWSDEDCIKILKKCKEAIPANIGKVMILEGIIDEDGERVDDEYTGVRLSLDMVMMAITAQGKERTCKEWAHLLNEAGFSTHNVTNIKTIQFVIEAYP